MGNLRIVFIEKTTVYFITIVKQKSQWNITPLASIFLINKHLTKVTPQVH